MTDPRTALVAAGYDAMIDTWEAWKARIEDDPRAEWCEELLDRLPEGARVVELGCGGGTLETQSACLAGSGSPVSTSPRHSSLGRASGCPRRSTSTPT